MQVKHSHSPINYVQKQVGLSYLLICVQVQLKINISTTLKIIKLQSVNLLSILVINLSINFIVMSGKQNQHILIFCFSSL